ncbi:capsule assembly Wzi family protein [Mucilaginibacter sabulilitoris]|uniref:Capsule assembly Wzi family protein n=1 Tax=Mucilaginibacter sabulilitoris TaxID=1173583 RepID=A0ABZ0TUQ5_9SPHI|nr:capsule assembly Wzi family protein [Mucilaginibacter sabulilitoris]WPU95808.1 capsule assembly Wzi family protein [Mucilaginibacter sabulilitoris]
MRTIKIGFFAIALLVMSRLVVHGQSLPVGTVALEDYYRRGQLLGNTDSSVSFMVRPLFPSYIKNHSDAFYPDSTEKRYNLLRADGAFQSADGKLKGSFLPLNFQTQFNSDHPYGWNDGAMIPAKGLQTFVSAGIFMQYGPLTIQFRPEFVSAVNPKFDTFNGGHYDVIFARYYDIYNNIDLPVRFGPSAYNRAFWGQSSIRLNYKTFSFGLSTENLWWGPGIRNSLLMSNSAPGFKHLTLNTLRPIKTPLGFFEGQLIAGRLENSGFPPLVPDHVFFGTNLYVPKPTDWRYLSGIIVTWQPKWIPGLFLGFDQSSQIYGKNLNGLKDYLPFFSPIKSSTAPDNPLDQKDQRSSLFMRWLWTAEHAEIYFEWGHNNSSADLTQSLLSPDKSRAYIWGLRKVLPFNRSRDENIMIGVEVATLQENDVNNILNGTEWYVSKSIPQGYTNRGEGLGAGIGPGANLQSLDISWVKGLKRLGLQIERYAHNNDFYYYAFTDSKDFRRHWVDLSLALDGEWNYKNLIFNAKIQGIRAINYQWYLTQGPADPYFVNGINAYNLQIQAGVTYRF